MGRTETVTRGGWGVSTTSPLFNSEGKQIPGVELHVYKFPYPNRMLMQKGDGYGRRFPTSEAAWEWALVHGYLQPYYPGSWCKKHRCQHTFLGRRALFCPGVRKEEKLAGQYVPMWKVRKLQELQSDMDADYSAYEEV